jgi:hypothetical protein
MLLKVFFLLRLPFSVLKGRKPVRFNSSSTGNEYLPKTFICSYRAGERCLRSASSICRPSRLRESPVRPAVSRLAKCVRKILRHTSTFCLIRIVARP